MAAQPQPGEPEIRETLEELAEVLVADLDQVFGHPDVEASVHGGPPLTLELEGAQGVFSLRWPPGEEMTVARGRMGAHARIALEFALASQRPGEFFEGYRPVSGKRRRLVFDRLRFYVEDSLGETGFYDPMVILERGPAMLVYCDDEYALVCEAGQHRGHGVLHWKVKRLVTYALTDADEVL